MEKKFSGQNLCSCAFGANIRSYTKHRAQHGTPFLQPPPPSFGGRPCHPPRAEQFSGRPISQNSGGGGAGGGGLGRVAYKDRAWPPPRDSCVAQDGVCGRGTIARPFARHWCVWNQGTQRATHCGKHSTAWRAPTVWVLRRDQVPWYCWTTRVRWRSGLQKVTSTKGTEAQRRGHVVLHRAPRVVHIGFDGSVFVAIAPPPPAPSKRNRPRRPTPKQATMAMATRRHRSSHPPSGSVHPLPRPVTSLLPILRSSRESRPPPK